MKAPKSPSRIAFLAMIALLLGAAGFWALHRPKEAGARVQSSWTKRGVAKPNVVLVTLDTTRADHLGCYGDRGAETPNLDGLARRGVLFEQAAAVAPLTLPAHSSIMTGMYPTHHGVRVNGNTALGQAQTTLAEALAGEGYQTAAFIAAFVLDGRWGLNQGFQTYDDRFDMKKYKHLDLAGVQRPANEVMDAALGWLEAHRRGPFFAWVHLYDPHSPYEPPEPYASRFGGRGPAGLYDGEIAFADSQVGRLVSWLHGSGLDEKTVVVVIGDHGEGLGSHGEGTHGYFVYDYAVHVQLLVATPFPEFAGVRVASQVSAVDVLPTVLALCGIESPAGVHGRSLVPLMLHPGTPSDGYAYGESMTANLQFGWSPLHSLRTSRYKLIEAPRPELYDLSVDRDETNNVIAGHPDVAEKMKATLDQLIADTSRDAPEPESANLDKETLESLAALGYIGAPVGPKASAPGKALADPKDKLGPFTIVQRAGELLVEEKYAEASKELETALGQDPEMPQARLMLGTCYGELGRSREAKAQFDRVLKDDPKSVQALIGLASVLQDEGRSNDVIALCKRTLSLDERNNQAYALLGETYAGRNEPDKALPNFEKAVEIQPKLTRNRLNLAGTLIEARQYGRAETMLKEIVRDYPKFPLAQFNLGLLYDEQGRPAEARLAYAAEVAAYPEHFKARFNLGKVLFQLEDREGAVAQMREVIRLAPKQPEGYLFLARGLLQQSAPVDEVQPLVEKGLSLARAPDVQALGYYLLADVFNRKGQPERVNEALRQAERYASATRARSRHETGNP